MSDSNHHSSEHPPVTPAGQPADRSLSVDDPRLTAFALGELPASEVALMEAQMAADPELRSTVAEVRSQGEQLRGELATRLNAPGLTPEHEEFVLATARRMAWRLEPVAHEPRPLSARLRVSEKEMALFWSGIGAAAAVMVMVAWQAVREPGGSSDPGPVAAAAGQQEAPDESPVMNVRFLDAPGTGVGRAAADADEPAVAVRRLPSGFGQDNAGGGWWPLSGGAGAVMASADAGAGVWPAAAFPLWVDDAGFDLARAALVERGELPEPGLVRSEQWVNAVNAPMLASAAEGDDGEATGRSVDEVMPGIWLASEVATAPWAPGHELVQVQVRLEGERLRQFRRGAQVLVEPNPELVDAFRLLGFDRTGPDPTVVGTAAGGGASDGGGELAEPDSYTVTALAEVRRRPDAGEGDLLRFRLEPVDLGGGEAFMPMAAVAAAGGAGIDWQQASDDFKAAAAAAELALILGGDLPADGYARLLEMGRSEALDGTAARRQLARMIAVAADLGGDR